MGGDWQPRVMPSDRIDGKFESDNLCFAYTGNFFLILHTQQGPSDGEWKRYLETAERVVPAGQRMLTLVFTDGGAPSKPQRDAVLAVFKARDAPVSVISPSAAVRFVISSLALFGMKIRGHSPQNWRDAFDHLRMPTVQQAQCEAAMRSLWNASFAPRCATWTSARGH